MAVLQRVVLPLPGTPSALPLYVDGPVLPLDRRSVRVPAGATAGFGTWFGAFPAATWVRWTGLSTVGLALRLSAPAVVVVRRSDADGRVTEVHRGTHAGAVSLEVPLGGPDGGWVWFEVVAGEECVVSDAAWCGPEGEPGGVTVAITTFDRPAGLLGLLRFLAAEPEVLAVVDEVVVVDQGTERADFDEVRAALGGRLRVVEQPNLGGSGGFARGMLEASGSRFVLLLDDDVVPEPESVLRAVALSRRALAPVLVSGSMLDLWRPTVLHTPGERIDPARFLWETVPPGRQDADLAGAPLPTTPWLHRRLDVDFAPWWCCLLPMEVVRRVGLPLPLFLKWDDAEHGLRSGRAGVPTVALPGCSVWHEPWTGKADTLDWQAYFHARNRLVAALLHSTRPVPLRMLAESVEHTLRPLVAMRYAVVELRLAALEDALAGPDGLHDALGTRLAEVRALRARHPDGRTVTPSGLPGPPPVRRPRSRAEELLRLAVLSVPRRTLRTDDAQAGGGTAESGRAVRVTADDAHWWRLGALDRAEVETAAGTVHEHRRDAATHRRLLVRTLVLHARTALAWPRLAARWRAAAPELVSQEAWERTLRCGARPG